MTMRWSAEADRLISRVPFFIRRQVRRRVEEEARQVGAGTVLPVHVRAAQTKFLQHLDREVKGWQLETCLGVEDCPQRAVAPGTLVEDLERLLGDGGLRNFLRRKVSGPLKPHHEFRVSLSACPNACSRPQIADIGLIGASRPALTEAPCSVCGQCVEVCREAALIMASGPDRPLLDLSRCVSCGQCTDVCPTGCIQMQTTGFRILLGGKLGRHPRLARELPGIQSQADVLVMVARALEHFRTHYQPGDRFGDILGREKWSG